MAEVGHRPSRAQNALFLAGAAAIVLWSAGPFLWQISTSFQLDRALVSPTPSLIPHPIILQHFLNIFLVKHFQFYVLNSTIVALSTTLLCLTFGAMAAYALSRLKMRWRFGLLGLILSV